MSVNVKVMLAVMGAVTVTASGAWAQNKPTSAQAAQKAQALGFTPSMLSGLTPAEQRTLTNLLNRMTTAERQAVAKLVRNSKATSGSMPRSGMSKMSGGNMGTAPPATGTGTTTPRR